MIVTTEWMHRNFRRFNTEYFGGKMPVPAFALSGARTQARHNVMQKSIPERSAACLRLQDYHDNIL